ncbi:MAG: hypothetical protein H0V51_16590 [Chloroflexi bacterium]|nr:hypothetical protein [Chloroflexota bacterium]
MPRTPEDIADEDDLYRRLGPDHVKPDGAISRTAFMRNSTVNRNRKEPDPEISVDLARLTTPALTLTRANRPTHGVGSLVAAYPRSLGLSVRHTPTDENWAHSSIEGNQDRENCYLLARATTILIPPQSSPSPR